jgi:hypothetical protein
MINSAYGRVYIDSEVDYTPQQMISPNLRSPIYSDLYDDYGQRLDTPCWDPLADPVQIPCCNTDRFWNSELFSTRIRRSVKMSPTDDDLHLKYASESNIDEAVDMTLPGLRRIPKDNADFTSTEESSTPTLESPSNYYYEHIYCSIDDNEENIYEEVPPLMSPVAVAGFASRLEPEHESGFFSYQEPNQFYHWDPPIPPLAEEDEEAQQQHITMIPISSDRSVEPACSSISVNGSQFPRQHCRHPPVLEQRQQTVIPIRADVNRNTTDNDCYYSSAASGVYDVVLGEESSDAAYQRVLKPRQKD